MTLRLWKLVLDGANLGSYNMGVDEALLNAVTDPACPATTYLRFYQWKQPTLSIGFSQKASKVVNFNFCRENKIDVVRRITGGKAVLHHHEITYSVTSNDSRFFPTKDITETYKGVALALAAGFKSLGLDTSLAAGDLRNQNSLKSKSTVSCFALSNHYEILCQGRKLVGSAQRHRKNAFLQHGSILLEFDSLLLSKTLGSPDLCHLQCQVTSLASCLGFYPQTEQVIAHLRKGFQDFFGIDEYELSSLDGHLRQSAESLSQSKYACL